MKRVFLTFLMIYLTFSSATSQIDTIVVEPVDVISPPLAYELQRDENHVTLSDSLKDKNITGFVVTSVFMNKDHQMLGFRIEKLMVLGKKDTLIDYINQSPMDSILTKTTYPKDVSKFYDILTAYINRIRFKRNHKTRKEEITRISFLTRLK